MCARVCREAKEQGFHGAMLQMIAHGIITGALGTLAMIALTVLIIVGIVEFGDEFEKGEPAEPSARPSG